MGEKDEGNKWSDHERTHGPQPEFHPLLAMAELRQKRNIV